MLQGVAREGAIAYLGVPFAAPPIGDLRWRAPQPAPHWSGVRVADHFGAYCTQDRSLGDPDRNPITGVLHQVTAAAGNLPSADPAAQTIVSEDCLYLNLWAPSHRTSAKLPVMVWIHGGAFEHVSGSDPITNGASLARRGAVVVTLNYRLGLFGFFAHPALTQESSAGLLGNYGLLDQIAALQWVRQNISEFGGDSANVTLMGESAGGVSVSYLMASPLAKDLFQKAIIESGFISDGPRGSVKTLQQAEAAGVAAAKSWGLDSVDAATLRKVPAATVLGNGPKVPTWPFIDGKIIRDEPLAAFESGDIAHVPLLLGTNNYEVGYGPLRRAATGLSQAFAAQWPQVQAAFDGYGTHQTADIEAELFTDMLFTAPTRHAARAATKDGLPTYLYRFSYVRPAQRGHIPGAIHTDEIYAVFGTMSLAEHRPGADNQRVVDDVQSRWVHFARTGRPTEGAKAWPAFKPGAERLLDFTNTGPVVRIDYARARIDLAEALSSPPKAQ
jgi:para-nitrobenzyl esterase